MSAFTPLRINKSTKVHNLDYIRTENEPSGGDAVSAEPVKPVAPETK